MLKIVYIPELVDDVLAYLESKKRWEKSKNFPNFISNKKKKYDDYVNKMKILEKKYRRTLAPIIILKPLLVIVRFFYIRIAE